MSATADTVTAQSVRVEPARVERVRVEPARVERRPRPAPGRASGRRSEPFEAWVFVFGLTLLATLGVFFSQVAEYTTLFR